MRLLYLIFLTPIFYILALYFCVFPHEFAHSFMAWALGDKSNPFDIIYGGTSLENLLLMMHVSEDVDYDILFSTNKGWHAALIGFAGPGIATGGLFLLSLYLLQKNFIKKNPFLFYFGFMVSLINLAELYSFVPMRLFTTHDDMAHIFMGLNISPWWIYGIGGYGVACGIYYFLMHILKQAYVVLNLSTVLSRSFLMLVSVFILFVYFPSRAFCSCSSLSCPGPFVWRDCFIGSFAKIDVVPNMRWISFKKEWKNLFN
jgi:hypothetical protein